jgi:hypothetical protein
MDKIVIELLRNYIDNKLRGDRKGRVAIPAYSIFITWKCKTLQNCKYLLCTDLNDNKYYELTYNGDKKELYIDEYDKVNNVAIDMNHILQTMHNITI